MHTIHISIHVYTHIYTYTFKTNIPEFFQIFFEKKKKEKIITKIIKRSKLSKDAKNIFFYPTPLSLSLIHVTTQFRGKKEGEEGKKGKIIRWLRILNEKTRDKEADNR